MNQQNYPYYQSPFMNQMPAMSIDKVSSIEDAKKYQVYAGATVYLIDENEPYIYLKTADGSGKTTIRAFSLVEIDIGKLSESKYITRQDFDAFKQDILNSIKGMKGEKHESTVK